MTDNGKLVIGELDASHDRTGFRCGYPSLDCYLQKQAGQDNKRRISRVFVATAAEAPGVVVGYYTLSALAIDLEQLPPDLRQKLPRYSIPAALIGRLAVSQNAQGQGIGRMLITDAIKRTLVVGDEIAIYAMVVDAIDESAKTFYLRYGFQSLEADRRLFLPLKSLSD